MKDSILELLLMIFWSTQFSKHSWIICKTVRPKVYNACFKVALIEDNKESMEQLKNLPTTK